jgi:predicted pyridoxine 5'-phosphate oxidase superfamily flavin-nucleotide-binding protein
MPDQHREFFGLLPYVFIAARDVAGWPVAAILAGKPGFISSPDPVTLAIAGPADAGDPIAPLLFPGARFGLLGLDLSTRRRNRANGHVAAMARDGLKLAIEQSFGNCPQYIHLRDAFGRDAIPGAPAEQFDGLDAEARAQIAAADTFFVASGSADGLDISHRGGPAGFVRIEGDGLSIPDYRGNRFFNTFGNLLLDPRCALLFVDFACGDTLVVQGRAEILWDEKAAGAERRWCVQVERGWRRRGALPLRWRERAA